jgi:UPF0271 protein
MFIDLNCDMAEGLTNDALLMPYISSANIACGFHAGDEETMIRTVALAVEHHVSIGAHPGFADRENFGRTAMNLSPQEIHDLIAAQVCLLKKITDGFGAKIRHIKPHGALYNMSARDSALAATIAKTVYEIDPSLLLFGLSGSHSISEANKTGLKTVSEVFADRTYQSDGSLTPRTQPNAMIEKEETSIQQVLQMIGTGSVTSVQGETVPIVAETVCLHGDGMHAVAFAKKIAHTLQINHIGIKSF